MSAVDASQRAFFAALADSLISAGIPFMVSGSVASSVHGQPRATNDLDVVIDPGKDALEGFLSLIPRDWYVSADAAREALRRRSMFNVIDTASGWKADLIIRKDRPFSEEEFRRRTAAEVLGSHVEVVSPEDSILSKLEWSVESPSERQFQDALNVARQAGDRLDIDYLKHWAAEIGVDRLLKKLLDER